MEASKKKLQESADKLRAWAPEEEIRILNCASEDQCVGYRCRCTFQIIFLDDSFQYAIRESQKPVIIQEFPIANQRIQEAMRQLRLKINNKDASSEQPFQSLTNALTSITFSTSWDEKMCLVTMHYSAPILDENSWLEQGDTLVELLSLSQLTARSKKRILRCCKGSPLFLEDTLWLKREQDRWKATLAQDESSSDNMISVKYRKPEDAFCHPNPRVMLQALEWLLSRITFQASQLTGRKKLKLLELYSGCGAHTMPIACSGLVERIVCVELDERLVQSCQVNLELNAIDSSLVRIVSGDAGAWARKCRDEFDLLLVDPPKQGLDATVCDFAVDSGVEHLLYISCGRQALLRDLNLLSQTFEVTDLCLLDLFPGTYSVESLVHLRRKAAGTEC